MSRSDEPALSTITEAMWPFFRLLRQVRLTRRRRLAPVLLRMVASELDVEVEVVESGQGVEGLRDKAEGLVEDLQDLLGGNDHYEALDVVSDLIEALHRRPNRPKTVRFPPNRGEPHNDPLVLPLKLANTRPRNLWRRTPSTARTDSDLGSREP